MGFHYCINKFDDTSVAHILEVIQVSLAHSYSALAGSFLLLADFISNFPNFMLQSVMKN